MSEIAHVVVAVERIPGRPGYVTLIGEAGEADTDDVLAVVEHGPVELAAAGAGGVQVRRDDLDAVFAELARALTEEHGAELSAQDLAARAEIVGADDATT